MNACNFAAEMWRDRRIAALEGTAPPHLESVARNCDIGTTLCMSRAHGTYVPPSVVVATNNAYVRDNNNKKRETPWSRQTQQREMIHGLRPIHCRAARPHCRKSCAHSPWLFPLVRRRDDGIASTPGRARDRTLSQQQQI